MSTASARVLRSSLATTSFSFGDGAKRVKWGLDSPKGLNLQQGHKRQVRMSRGGASRTTTSPQRNVRADLLFALTSQAAIQSQRAVQSLATEAAKYVNSRRSEARNLEEALMTVPNLETIPYKVIRREEAYEIRDVESYLVAETEMAGRSAFDFMGSGQGFNTLAEYLFGKNKKKEVMEMTTPVVVVRDGSQSQGEKMEMTTPVISKQGSASSSPRMAFVIPSKFTEGNVPIPDNSSVKIRRVPSRRVAVIAFSGYVTDDLVDKKELQLREALAKDLNVLVKEGTLPEVSQYNPPFTPPFARRNEIALEVDFVKSTV